MDILFWVIFLPLILLGGILLKSALFLFHPIMHPDTKQVTSDDRRYSVDALKVMEGSELNRELIENAIAKGKKTTGNRGVSYRYVSDQGMTILVITDQLGNVEAISV